MNNDIDIKLDLNYLLPHKKLILCYLQNKPYIEKDSVVQNLNNLKEFCIQNLMKTHGSRFCQKTYLGYTTIIMDKEYVTIEDNKIEIKEEEKEFVKCSLIHELLHIASRGRKNSGLLVNYSNSGGLNEGITQLLAEKISSYSVGNSRNTYVISECCAKLLMLICTEEKMLKSYFNHTFELEEEVTRLSQDSSFFYYFNSELSTIINLYKYCFSYVNDICKELEKITPAKEEFAEKLYNQKVKLFIRAITLFLVRPKLTEVSSKEKEHFILEFSSFFRSSPKLIEIMNDCIYCNDIEEKKKQFYLEREELDNRFALFKEIASSSFTPFFVMEQGICYLKYQDYKMKITSFKMEEEILSDSYFSKNSKESILPFIDFVRKGEVLGKLITIHLSKELQPRKEKLAAMNQFAKKNGYAFDYSNMTYDEEKAIAKVTLIPYQHHKRVLK